MKRRIVNLKKRSFLIIGIVFLVVVAFGAGYEVLVKKPSRPVPPTAAQLQAWQFPVSQITTNLNGSGVIQVTFTLQAPNAKVAAELQARTAQISNAIISVLHNMSSSEIMQPGGQNYLRGRVRDGINAFLTSGKLTTVYINSLIIQ